MRAGDGADDVERVGDIGDPVAQGLVHRILQGARAAFDRHHLGPQQLHAEHVGLLALDIDLAHVDGTGQAEEGGNGRGRNAMLAGARLGDDAALLHAPGHQDLAHAIVDLVRAGVVQLVALQIDLRPAQMLGQAPGEIERARPADIMLEVIVELLLEFRIGLAGVIGLFDLQDQRHQGFGDETPAEEAKAPLLVRPTAETIEFVH